MKGREYLAADWRARAARLREWAGAEGAATAWERAAAELDAMLATDSDDTLNLQEGALESGYSPGHLGRLVRSGKIPNAGRPNAPAIRRADLPSRPLRPDERKRRVLTQSGQIVMPVRPGGKRG